MRDIEQRFHAAFLLLCPCLLFGQADPLADGLEKFRRGRYLEAEQALSGVADDPRGRLFLALSRAATGRCAAAAPVLRREFDQSQDATLRKLAGLGFVQCALAQESPEAARPVLSRLREDHPDDADVLFQAAKYHMKAWNDTIYAMFRKAPGSYRVHQISAEIFEIQGKYAEAIGEYRKAIEKNPAAVNLHYRLARAILMESHEPKALEEARGEFEKELELNPNDAVAHYQVGQILLAQQQREAGAARIERAIQLQPDFGRAYVALGKLRLDDNQTGEAIRLFEEAVRLAPDSEAARYGLMRAYRRAGRKEDAMRQKEELDKLQRPPSGEFTDFLKRIEARPAAEQKPGRP